MTNLRGELAQLPPGALHAHLAALRVNIDDLTQVLGHEYGGDNEAVQRAEQLSAAIQRLEWALARQGLRSRSATVGA
jgi:hypothetical protein